MSRQCTRWWRGIEIFIQKKKTGCEYIFVLSQWNNFRTKRMEKDIFYVRTYTNTIEVIGYKSVFHKGFSLLFFAVFLYFFFLTFCVFFCHIRHLILFSTYTLLYLLDSATVMFNFLFVKFLFLEGIFWRWFLSTSLSND